MYLECLVTSPILAIGFILLQLSPTCIVVNDMFLRKVSFFQSSRELSNITVLLEYSILPVASYSRVVLVPVLVLVLVLFVLIVHV